MKLMGLSLKNATVKWWRSFTLAFFIFSVSFVMVVSSSFILAAKNKVEKVVLNGFTGHIQIRSDQSTEGDMVVQYSQGWDSLKPLNAPTIMKMEQILQQKFPDVVSNLLARQSAFLTGDNKREEMMLIGIDSKFNTYKDAFLLTKGRYLDPESTDEILLTEEQANTFKAGIGDRVKVTAKNMYGLNASADLKVVGIGNFIMLSLFSYKANYTTADVVRKLVGMKAGEVTDMVLFLPDKGKSTAVIQGFTQQLKNAGIKYALTADEKLKSDDLKVTEFSFLNKDGKQDGVKVSAFEEMGNTFKGISDTMFTMLNILVLFLIVIVSILIINLVYMAGIERYREIGTLRAIGFSRFQVVRIFMGEILFVSILSGVLGVLVSTGLVLLLGVIGITSPIPALDFIMGKTLNLEVDPRSIVSILGIIMGFSFAASFYPAYKACSIDPAQTIRTV